MIDEIEEQKAAEAIKVDADMYQFLTKETLASYFAVGFSVDHPDGDYIARFDRKISDKGISVSPFYTLRLLLTKEQVPGIDLRSGEYGLEYAGAGFFNAGCQFWAKGDTENALANLEKAIELNPRNILAHMQKAQIHSKNENYWLAAAEYGNMIVLNPVYIAERNKESRAALEKLPADFSKIMGEYLALSYHERGIALCNLGLNDEALADLNEAIRRDPNLSEAIYSRFTVFLNIEHWEEALADCDTLLAAGYGRDNMRVHRGLLLKQLGRYKEAIDDFNTALALDPGLTYLYIHRSECYYEEYFFEESLKDANRAVEKGIPYAHFNRAFVYSEIGEYTKAIADYDIAIQECPDNDDIKEMREESIDLKNRGKIARYRQKNENGEWEQVERIDGKIIKIEPIELFDNAD